ncbi:MAG: ABC transporter permease [Deltaproteobacteria bacterium]|nr:ABC transporter permease [Deltaproteobacteria bacterium]
MTRRSVFMLFEVLFWPCVWLVSVGLLTRFLELRQEMVAYVLVGVISMSIIQVCHLDVAFALLLDLWAKSMKHQFLAPIHQGHLLLGHWLMGVLRGIGVFALLAVFSAHAFGFDFLRAGVGPLALFLLGLFLNAAAIGVVVCILILQYGHRAEVAAWSLVSLMMLVCGIYYPVTLLPGAVRWLAELLPLTYFLEAFRAYYGFQPLYAHSLLKGYALTAAYLVGLLVLFQWGLNRARRTGLLLKLSE